MAYEDDETRGDMGGLPRLPQFLVFANRDIELAHLNPGDVAVIEAHGVEDAALGYALAIGIDSDEFLDYVCGIDRENNLIANFCDERGEFQSEKMVEFFGDETDFLQEYQKHLRAAERQVPSGADVILRAEPPFPVDMLMFLWEQSDSGAELEVIALKSIPHFYLQSDSDGSGDNIRVVEMLPEL